MADGTSKAIVDLKVGDKVLGKGGKVNVVEKLREITEKTGFVYSLNGRGMFVTAGHPFYTKKGWKAIDPEQTPLDGHNLPTPVARLELGDELVRPDGTYEKLMSIAAEPLDGRKVYNPAVSGDQTYFAYGLLVHNKGGGS